ncbi:hypothetical protein [Flavobacterium sp. HSC-61S13]|uniref:hypothetical protein n=1 Tax=Flavobacterium sp. HSC-61S13 TaxID=2910963 RepID=UPI0020A0F8CF|nr:hypothetical protein [Flavobacterium sp. HSC-61S13]MCP1997073.1 hypothetical protein [Flavobacterium sp. HSC-61S13]
MNCNRTILLLLFILCFPSTSLSQTAEKLFGEGCTKFSFVLQPAIHQGYSVGNVYDNSTNSPSISFNNPFSIQFGFFYNFYQINDFNFKAGLIAKTFNPTFNIHISEEDWNVGYNYSNELGHFQMASQFVFSQTFKTEYFHNISENLNFVLGLGTSLDLRTSGGNDKLVVSVFDYNQQKERTLFIAESDEQQITGSLDFSVGLNYLTNRGLFQMDVFFNSQLLNYPKQGVYQFDLDNNETKTGVYTIKGNYAGISLIFTPTKGWLKKKST